MKVAIWDTYVQREDERMMHFDIVVPDTLKSSSEIHKYGTAFLRTKSFNTSDLTSKECTFCHIENANETIVSAIQKNGYYIIEMENCD